VDHRHDALETPHLEVATPIVHVRRAVLHERPNRPVSGGTVSVQAGAKLDVTVPFKVARAEVLPL
jgi:hypothetical protein